VRGNNLKMESQYVCRGELILYELQAGVSAVCPTIERHD